MTRAVLVMSIGPVQDFIAQARRSRDLWFGSHVLSEVSRAAAGAATRVPGVQLVFPALDPGDAELEPCDAPIRETSGTPPLNVGNHLLAIVPADQARAIARSMKQAAIARWCDMAYAARSKADGMGLLANGIDDVWREQTESLLEVSAASASFHAADGYAAARRTAERTLSARKNLRDFRSWKHDRAGAPKSSLDGGRVSVLAARRGDAARQHGRTVRLGAGEQLDAVGVVKRLGGDPDQFVPLANVALADWVERAREKAPEQLRKLADACRGSIGRVYRRDLAWTHWIDNQSFDAEVLLEGRLPGVLVECGLAERTTDPAVIEWRRQHLDPLHDRVKAPPVPAVCCLVADGDNMGRAIDGIGDPEQHRRLSSRLAMFASESQRILADHKGFAVYTGGDDVLGFLAPAHAPSAARALHAAFTEAMRSLDFIPAKPTLSVGLGIGHILDGMAHLLKLGRRAEKLAKQGRPGSPRNALAVIVDRRSGGEVGWCGSWRDDPVQQIETLSRAWGKTLPAGKVHELRAMFNRMPLPAADVDTGFTTVLHGEVHRILGRANVGMEDAREPIDPAQLGLDLPIGLPYAEAHGQVAAWLGLSMVAREFSARSPLE